MTRRAGWLWAGVGASLLLLLLGRWLAVSTASRLWASAVGVGEAHADINRLRSLLVVAAFGAALAWFIGNLSVVYRAVASVNLARQVGDLEILEAVPRRYLQILVVGVAVVLAAILSRESGDWWAVRALAATTLTSSMTDPVLELDIAYYLFRLPWHLRLHGFAMLGVTGMLAVAAALYLAIGAIRWTARRVRVSSTARVHLAALLAVLALVLFWGYRLEPAEYVGGIREVAFDPTLTEVRLPTARLLGVLALVAFAGSVGWMWIDRIAVVVPVWFVLVVASLLGHHVVPAFATTVRRNGGVAAEVAEARREFTAFAYGMHVVDTVLQVPSIPHPSRVRPVAETLRRAPTWDPFAARAYLNRTLTDAPFAPFLPLRLDVYEGRDRDPVPLYVGVKAFDFSGPRSPARELSWEDVHVGPYASPRGVVALDAVAATQSGTPRFVPRIDVPDSTVEEAVELVLRDGSLVFSPGNTDFALVPARTVATRFGVPVRGMWRRLAFAWRFQSAQLIAGRPGPTATLVWHRDVTSRLERYAPFARFGEPLPVIEGSNLYWLAPGYVAAKAFPISQGIEWKGERVRYLRAGFIGVVEAQTGETAVYLARGADPLSEAWADLLPAIVRPHGELLPTLQRHERYPQELFLHHATLLRERLFPKAMPASGRRFIPRRWLPADDDSEAYWWFGPGVADSVPQLRIRMAVETREPARLTAILDGTMQEGVPLMRVLRIPDEVPTPGPSQLLAPFAQARLARTSVPGQLRAVPTRDGILYVQAAYRETNDNGGAPALEEVVVGWGATVTRAATLLSALQRASTTERSADVGSVRWQEAVELFQRMDDARRRGNWAAFGAAYDALRALFATRGDSAP